MIESLIEIRGKPQQIKLRNFWDGISDESKILASAYRQSHAQTHTKRNIKPFFLLCCIIKKEGSSIYFERRWVVRGSDVFIIFRYLDSNYELRLVLIQSKSTKTTSCNNENQQTLIYTFKNIQESWCSYKKLSTIWMDAP